eukprot:4160636-Prymnesium_polylepis.1
MVAEGVWEDVAIASMSDFGRTLTPNGNEGTDHGWGDSPPVRFTRPPSGNTFVLSGSLNGAQIFGRYPSGMTDDAEQTIGRG